MSKLFKSCVLATALGAVALAGAAHAQYPERPITLVVTSTPGSPLDLLARQLGSEAAKDLGQTVIVENRPGASGNVGGSYVSRSAPDGYTVMLTLDNQATVNPQAMTDANFNALTDLKPVALVGTFSQVLVAPKQVGVSNLEEFMKLAKERELNYGTAGVGSPGHLTMAAFAETAGLKMIHIPYKGNPPAVNDMLAGVLDSGFLVVSGVLPHIQSGSFVPLAVSGAEPNALLPEVPTVASSGIPGLENFNSTFGYLIAMPKDTPDAIVTQWNTMLHDILKRPNVAETLKMMDIAPVFKSPEESAEYLQAESKRWGPVIESANIRLN